MARPAGIEPATAGLEGRCSIRLSYGRLTQQKLIAPNVFSRPMFGSVQTESEVRADYIEFFNQLKSLLPCARPAARVMLTSSAKHHILCPIAVPGTNSGPKRESGPNPELPRSGGWERTMSLALSGRRESGLGKRHAVGVGATIGRTPVSPKTCRDPHLERDVVRLWSSRGRSGRDVLACAARGPHSVVPLANSNSSWGTSRTII